MSIGRGDLPIRFHLLAAVLGSTRGKGMPPPPHTKRGVRKHLYAGEYLPCSLQLPFRLLTVAFTFRACSFPVQPAPTHRRADLLARCPALWRAHVCVRDHVFLPMYMLNLSISFSISMCVFVCLCAMRVWGMGVGGGVPYRP